MTQHLLAPSHAFSRISEELSAKLDVIEKQIQQFYKSSSYLQMKENFGEKLVEWQKSLSRIQSQFSHFPEEVFRSEIVINLKKRLEEAENVLANFRKSIEMTGVKLLSSRSNLQWGRKIFHTSSGLFGLWLYAYSGFPSFVAILLLTAFFVGSVGIEVVRRVWPQTNNRICQTFSFMMREKERRQISSATWYMGSVLFLFLVFPKEVAVPTLWYVAVGDTIAGIVGSQWGRHRLAPHVSLEGCLSGWGVCFVGSLFFGSDLANLHGFPLFVFSFVGAIVGALSETLLKKWDDNLTIPLISAPCLWLLIQTLK
ncbi:MAG: hypothetical protein IPJ69_04290 [Deltaproteobacteria bacterium]|nr:MAG: hypothetical protein IPJ69_04290 [Deltaproteobacteria bacterium]